MKKKTKGKPSKYGDSFKVKTIERAETVQKRAEDMADIEMLRIKEGIGKTPTRGYEINAVVGLFACTGAMEMIEGDVKGRLREVKNGLRDWGGAKAGIRKSVQRILATMPDEKVESLLRMKDHLGFRTYLDRRVADGDDGITVIRMDDLEVLISASHEYCKMCDRDCDRCRLGKALDRVQPETREKGRSWMMMDIGDFNPDDK